ncbi:MULTISPECIES: glucosamine-6-phosphate deaminase [Actinomyces]|uniref:Glucosamine-6-phosphate deaminase n=3 Tax=Actinomyces TaxID=1654 RepID=A0A1M4S060_9ACTO|nr:MULTISPECIES: glucosamine-6-phosphate deaminase [Actinomyces]MBM6978792.1 glucosamine-6-phosphate deaminase [Actinomyces succiniciruminis]RAX23821.1 glucosamine-6-phosphate deaminase [Actinomyces sp. Z3]CED90325.1 Glucosamine-6-phosphate deaminase [Actinomyces succiniciruminis]SHE25592.1 glucosamine/galactosamine-6-phosphate isomerases signature [Actinomyces glycerinitolerans]
MELVILDTAEEIASRAADVIESLLKDKPNAVLGTATGSSPLPLYDELTRRCAEGRISFKDVTGFMLDEYVGLPEGHPERYATFMERNLRSRVDMAPGALHGPDALADDLEQACADYEAQMAAAGYCDLQILGIGADGHIGFNEPGGPLDSATHVDVLTEQTRSDNARFFDGDIDAVPTHCLTQGLGTIMKARKLVLIATGANKAEAIAHLVEGEITPDWPATVMQNHPDALVLVDHAAAGLLKQH